MDMMTLQEAVAVAHARLTLSRKVYPTELGEAVCILVGEVERLRAITPSADYVSAAESTIKSLRAELAVAKDESGKLHASYNSEGYLTELGRLRGQVEETAKAAGKERAEVERLRTELEQSRIAERVAVDKWKQGNEAYDGCDRERSRLRAELADSNGDAMNLQSIIDELRAELDWFRLLENKLTKHQWYYDYMEENPKPGAGT